MNQNNERRYVIDLNGKAARTNLKILALTYPFWSLAVVFLARDVLLWYASLFCMMSVIALSIYSNRIFISRRSITFAHNFLKRYQLKNLSRLSLSDSTNPEKDSNALLNFHFEDGTKQSISLVGMDERMKVQLLTALDNFTPNCQKPRDVRTALSAVKQIAAKANTSDRIDFKYDDRFAYKQMKSMVAQYQNHFWKGWTLFATYCTLIAWGAIILTFFQNHGMAAFEEHSLQRNMLTTTVGLIGFSFGWMGVLSALVYSVAKIEYVTWAIIIGATAVPIALYRYFVRPNLLTISPDKITLNHKTNINKTAIKELLWANLSSVTIQKLDPDPDRWQLVMSATTGQDLRIYLGAVESSRQIRTLIESIENYAPSAILDPEILSALKPSDATTYTSLWISSLTMAPSREKLAPLSPGLTLKNGSYLIEELCGSGGQGQTYLAKHLTGGDEKESFLILKESIIPVFGDSQERRKAIEDFEKDALLLANLKHPQIVKLLDYFVEDHRAYLVLEHIQGQNLRQRVSNSGPLLPSEVLALSKQMAEILAYLHRQNPSIVHRDFTPENLMLDALNDLTLIDFGVAQAIKSRTTATVVGKHSYLPPEQLRGQASPQSDLYAMAATLYFLLVGQDPEPLSKLNPLTIIEESRGRQQILSEAEIEIAKTLSHAIEKATALDCRGRTVSADAFLQDLNLKTAVEV